MVSSIYEDGNLRGCYVTIHVRNGLGFRPRIRLATRVGATVGTLSGGALSLNSSLGCSLGLQPSHVSW